MVEEDLEVFEDRFDIEALDGLDGIKDLSDGGDDQMVIAAPRNQADEGDVLVGALVDPAHESDGLSIEVSAEHHQADAVEQLLFFFGERREHRVGSGRGIRGEDAAH
jgi:hypothetical protein